MDWAAARELPVWMRAAMAALQLDRPSFDALDGLSEIEWRTLLAWLDRQQMTPLFGRACADRLPPAVAARIAGNLEANRVRLGRLREDYRAIAEALETAQIPHTVLKGFTHGPPFVPAAELRPQYDLDLLVSPNRLAAAQDILRRLGFEASDSQDAAPTDHAPPMVRRTGWTWRGDYFDPEIPTVVELHFRLWDAKTEGFAAPGLQAEDRPAYAAAHALRHLLRGSLKALHVYELVHFLQAERDLAQWRDWPARGTPELRRIQGLMYRLGRLWFGGQGPAFAAVEAEPLPPAIHRWIEQYGLSPLAREERPNKDELWLHLELIEDWRGRVRVARRRLLPLKPPGRLEGQYDRKKPAMRERLGRGFRYAGFFVRRLAFHSQTLLQTFAEVSRRLRERRAFL